jgi:hypothetical protein
MKKLITPILVILILLDVVYVAIIFPHPEFWFKTLHGAPYVDPQGLLFRTGAVWASFALFQFIALIKWRKAPYWLMLVAGIRLTEVFADWVHLYYAQNMTSLGRMSLLAAPIVNGLTGWFFFRAYLKVTSTSTADH